MKVIGAKELRLHLNQVLDRVIGGEDIVVQHRFKDPVMLSALRKIPQDKGKLTGLQAFDEAAKRPSPFDPNKPIKELYRESTSPKYDSQ